MKDIKELLEYIKKNFKERASLYFLDEDGFPLGNPIEVELNGDLKLRIPDYSKPKSSQVFLVFNHITELPTGGYTDRRYVVIKGKLEIRGGEYFLVPMKHYMWDEKLVPFPMYCEMNVKRGREYLENLSKIKGKKIEPAIGIFWKIFKTVRLPFLLASVLPAIIGILFAILEGYFDLTIASLIIIGVSLIHLALNVANDYHDYITGADNYNLTPTPFSGGSRAIQHGIIEASTAFKIYVSLYSIAALIGLYLTILKGLLVLLFMIIGVFISYFYSAKPLRFSDKGLGEIMVGLGFGPIITVGSYIAMTGSFSLHALFASIPIGTLVALILYVNEIPDRIWDIKAGKLTIVARIKEDSIAKGYLIGIIITYISYTLCLLFNILPIYSTLVFALLPLAYRIYKGIKSNYKDPYSMIPICASHINLYTYFSLILIFSLLLEYFL